MSYIKHITGLFKDEIKGNILFVLDMFGSQNLQTLHELLKKPKSTILGHLKEMVELDQIELDSKATAAKTGKFYKLSPEIHELFNREDDSVTLKEDSLEKENILPEDFAIGISNLLRTVGFQSNLIATLTAQYIEENSHFSKDIKKYKPQLMGFFAGIYELSLLSKEEFEDVYILQKEFNNKLKKYDKNVDKKRKNAEHTLLFLMLGCSKDNIDPKNKFKTKSSMD